MLSTRLTNSLQTSRVRTQQIFKKFCSISTKRVIPFVNDPENVLIVGEAVFLHDKAPCMRAKASSAQRERSRFLGQRRLAGKFAWSQRGRAHWSDYQRRSGGQNDQGTSRNMVQVDILSKHWRIWLRSWKVWNRTEFLENLLCSYPARLKARGQRLVRRVDNIRIIE